VLCVVCCVVCCVLCVLFAIIYSSFIRGGAITDAGVRQCHHYGPIFREEMLRGNYLSFEIIQDTIKTHSMCDLLFVV
jgi:hypothetical protein